MIISNRTASQDQFLTNNDLLYVMSTLMTPKKEELKLRKIARVKSDFPSYAREIGYDVDTGEGGAVVTAAGAKPKDIPFVNESVDRVIQPAVDFTTAISYTDDEMEAAMAKRALGKGPAYPLDQRRVEKARRYISEKEDYTGFNGNRALKVPGMITSAGYIHPVFWSG
ncbi:DUF2184 domain-containing protein [Leptospira borgpetersenii]|nr:DUF2184 domain-containing protein [Leptospira borgpetersenii]AXX17433.1 DUF2184 domain-containing protein [Leptospira borgpetersenii serovar Ceylonica]MDQ7245915.1 DUF2184 domain-containing protein [Leptospira borgpetersenii]PTM48117.1 uncharacterized protein DUF2184 [Leptospira borgpetersenii serovar Javanica]QVK49440.1 DUF2184 domain-containing protein [Leptospira borgpetersenii]QVK52772.1 DUF2184 domain-containing protein [Leptospira borgpetersenii]